MDHEDEQENEVMVYSLQITHIKQMERPMSSDDEHGRSRAVKTAYRP